MKIHNRLFIVGFFTLVISSFSSCDDFIHVPAPENTIVRETVFESDASANAAILSLYSILNNQSNFSAGWLTSLTYLNSLNSDELMLFATGEPEQFYTNNILPSNSTVSSIWGSCYNLIYASNAIIEGLQNSSNVTPARKKQLMGEAKFIRSFCHFYLVNLFGDVPYITATDYRKNSVVSRTTAQEINESIVNDLREAEELLPNEYVTSGRVRVNKWVAKAFLARVYLYSKSWEDAEKKATEIINNTGMYSLVEVDKVFLKESSEAIWQLFPMQGIDYTMEGELFILNGPPSRVSLDVDLVDSFEDSDLRRSNWINPILLGPDVHYYAFKYKENSANSTGSEYSMVLRLAEQFLIRAEARLWQNKLTGINSAESDINIIRARAGLNNTTATSQLQLLDAIEQERRVELFTEWGHRWFDLKRTDRARDVLNSKLGWEDTDVLWPIPESEIITNKNLSPQNSGY